MAKTKKAAPKKESKKDILKRLGDPKLSSAEKNKLMEKLYKNIEIK